MRGKGRGEGRDGLDGGGARPRSQVRALVRALFFYLKASTNTLSTFPLRALLLPSSLVKMWITWVIRVEQVACCRLSQGAVDLQSPTSVLRSCPLSDDNTRILQLGRALAKPLQMGDESWAPGRKHWHGAAGGLRQG